MQKRCSLLPLRIPGKSEEDGGVQPCHQYGLVTFPSKLMHRTGRLGGASTKRFF